MKLMALVVLCICGMANTGHEKEVAGILLATTN